jgi:hypothetical protein
MIIQMKFKIRRNKIHVYYVRSEKSLSHVDDHYQESFGNLAGYIDILRVHSDTKQFVDYQVMNRHRLDAS